VFLRSILLGDWGTTDREAVEEVHERIDGIETERTDENAATRSHAPPEPPASRLPETARLRPHRRRGGRGGGGRPGSGPRPRSSVRIRVNGGVYPARAEIERMSRDPDTDSVFRTTVASTGDTPDPRGGVLRRPHDAHPG
jgi:hypothetical protein